MKRKIVARAALGFPLGIALGHVITVIISLIVGDGEFYPCKPEFVELIGGEAAAAAVQTVLCGFMGSGFAAASAVWETDRLNIAVQTGICFGIYAVSLLPIAYFTNWMEHSPTGIMSYVGIFAAAFVFVWIIQYMGIKRKIKRLNAKLSGQ